MPRPRPPHEDTMSNTHKRKTKQLEKEAHTHTRAHTQTRQNPLQRAKFHRQVLGPKQMQVHNKPLHQDTCLAPAWKTRKGQAI